MALLDVATLALQGNFINRVQAALVAYIQNTVNAEAANDQATLTVTGAPTGGSFTLGGGPLTGAVAPAWNDTAQTLAARINAALPAGENCVCTGGPLPGTQVVINWLGNLADSPQLALTLNANNLTGGSSPGVTIGHNVGVAVVTHEARAALASKIVTQSYAYAQMMAPTVANDANVQSDYTSGHDPTQVTDGHISAAVSSVYNSFI